MRWDCTANVGSGSRRDHDYAQLREEISTEIQTAYKAAFGLLRDDLDALRHEQYWGDNRMPLPWG